MTVSTVFTLQMFSQQAVINQKQQYCSVKELSKKWLLYSQHVSKKKSHSTGTIEIRWTLPVLACVPLILLSNFLHCSVLLTSKFKTSSLLPTVSRLCKRKFRKFTLNIKYTCLALLMNRKVLKVMTPAIYPNT